MKCYVAGKLNDDAVGYIRNMHRMIKVARQLRELDISVYVPCNDFLERLVVGNFSYEDYFKNSQPWLKVSDFVFVCEGWEKSTGTQKEITLARSIGIPVFFDIETLKYALTHQGL